MKAPLGKKECKRQCQCIKTKEKAFGVKIPLRRKRKPAAILNQSGFNPYFEESRRAVLCINHTRTRTRLFLIIEESFFLTVVSLRVRSAGPSFSKPATSGALQLSPFCRVGGPPSSKEPEPTVPPLFEWGHRVRFIPASPRVNVGRAVLSCNGD